mmetsp:Transcript_5748/g.9943  ORF Transcript_5748/g.9943 Transcript_5748/m.9943 type:complete len:235 (-) Transcript_5748:97-801(-)
MSEPRWRCPISPSENQHTRPFWCSSARRSPWARSRGRALRHRGTRFASACHRGAFPAPHSASLGRRLLKRLRSRTSRKSSGGGGFHRQSGWTLSAYSDSCRGPRNTTVGYRTCSLRARSPKPHTSPPRNREGNIFPKSPSCTRLAFLPTDRYKGIHQSLHSEPLCRRRTTPQAGTSPTGTAPWAVRGQWKRGSSLLYWFNAPEIFVWFLVKHTNLLFIMTACKNTTVARTVYTL